MYIIWDNSNIHFAGLNQVLPAKEPEVDYKSYRTYFKGLLDLVAGKRNVDKIFFAGSEPPSKDKLWSAVEKLGATVQVIPRCVTGGEENTTDHLLELEILRLGYDSVPSTIALLTGMVLYGSKEKVFLPPRRGWLKKAGISKFTLGTLPAIRG